MEIASSVVAEIVSKLVDASIHQALYPFRFNRYVKELETQKMMLQSKIESVVDRANESKKKTEKIVIDVEKWLNDAYSLMERVVELEENAKKRRKKSCLKYCPNWIRRYGLAKQLEEKISEITKHSQIEFPEFSRLATLVGMKYFSSEGFVCFESRKVAYEGLLEALKDDEVRMIGLYGMGGCGKTTMAKEVGKEAEQFFNKVIFVVVSNPINIRKIQSKIASQLDNFKLPEEEEPELRAKRLFMKLTSGENILIILDDVWEILDFKEIGIPTNENQRGCTVLITTRKLNVCTLMKCQRTIHLKVLDEEEAWSLFQKHAEMMYDDNSDMLNLKGLAQEIAKEGCGLPVAIAAVASTLKNKTHDEWTEALETLKESSLLDIEEGLKNPYACLQLSYDNLRNEVDKSLFVLCSVFPEDFKIPIDVVTMIAIGLGLVGEVGSYKRARNRVSMAKNKLIDSCLLLKVDEDQQSGIKMHDLVRDVALWIAKKEYKLIMGPEWSQKALKDDLIIKDARIKYLWLDEVDKFPNELDCPELEFLYVSTKSQHDVDVTNEFFKGLKKLRVLYLKKFSRRTILQLSNSVHLMNNLCCLILDGWLLGDISFIGSLEKLVSLQLLGCSFDELPNGIIQQKKLRLLELGSCEIKKNPYEVIGQCSQLEELYFFENSGKDWEGQSAAEYFDKVSITPALERYYIDLGNSACHLVQVDFPETRSLYIENFDACISNATIKDLMQRAEFLSLGGVNRSCKYIFPGIVQSIGGGLNALTRLTLRNSENIECMIDNANHLGVVGTIPNLTHLTITRMMHLKSLCCGQPPKGLFAKLEVLLISNCNSLVHIITDEEAKEIIVDSTVAFSKLKRLSIHSCNQVEYLFPIFFARSLTQLEVLKIRWDKKLKTVFGHSNYEDQYPKKFQFIEFSALKELELSNLPSFISIFPESYHPMWPSLESLTVDECQQFNTRPGLRQADHIASEDLMKVMVTYLENLKSIFVENVKIDVIFSLEWLPITEQVVNSGLQCINLINLPELRHIWMGLKNFIRLQNLVELSIGRCGNLKVIFPASILRSIPQLKILCIRYCEELEEIIEEEENQNVSNPQLLFPHLTKIIIEHCQKLKRLFSVSTSHVLPKLEVMLIEEAPQLKQVFGDEQEDTQERIRKVAMKMTPELKLLWGLEYFLAKLINSIEDSSKETTKQSHSKETEVESASETCEDLSGSDIHSEQKMTCFNNLTQSLNETTKDTDGELLGLEVPSVTETSSNKPLPISLHRTASHEMELVNERSATETSLMDQKQQLEKPLGEYEIPQQIKRVKQSEDEIQSAQEETNVKGNIEESSTLENAKNVISSPKAFLHSQINIKQTETDIDENTKSIPIINLQDFEIDGGQIQISSVSSIRNDFVEKALSDLEVSLKLPLKDIAISEANTLHILTLLNFLSCLSVEDGALLPHGLKAIIKSLHQDLPSILYSFKPALAMINKFHKAQEKEARLMEHISMREKEIEDCEAKLSSLQEKKKTCVAEATEFKKEYESVMKENVEMVEDQRKAWQKLFDVDYKWSVLYSRFQQKNIDVHTRRIIHSVSENVIKSNEDSAFENLAPVAAPNLTETLNETTLGLGIPRTMETSYETEFVDRRSASEPSLNEISQGTKSDNKLEDEDQSAKVGNISEETSIVKGNIEEGSTLKNAKAFPHSQMNINQSVAIAGTTKDELVRKAISDMEVSLKMPLKDLATSKDNSLRLLTALNFLSCLSSDDGALPHGLKAVIDSLHQDFPSILCSFKSPFAKINKISKFMDEAQEKEARLKEHISKLENEIKDCDKKLSSVEEKKKKYVAETIELKKEFESVRKDKSEMEEHQRKAQQQIFQDNYRWSFLCSQFQLNNIDARNLC
ncbi:Disease resistance protein [Senna tora]|uniref:Disease resistance protein n=1 Tax=Senna tora TaxID=362788 RepID=A0A834WWN8_9FABA|nr:Disease resistance protein [Senna tora]